MKITFTEGINQGKEIEINSPCITIGRDGGNQLILDTDGVSRCHAELKQKSDGSWEICDLNSTNGVKVNKTRISGSAPVSNGCVIGIGENVLVIDELNLEPARVIFNPIISSPPSSVSPVIAENITASDAVLPSSSFSMNVPEITETPASKEPGEVVSPVSPQHSAELFRQEIKNFSGSLFGAKNNRQKASDEQKTPEQITDEKKKRRSNLVFYTTVVCVVIMILCLIFLISAPPKENVTPVREEQPLIVRYEKEIITRDNVFRFDFLIKSAIVTQKAPGNNAVRRQREYAVTFTIDDIASHRHFTRETPVSEETVNQLRESIRNSGIYNISAQAQARDESINRSITLVDGNRLYRIDVPGKYASAEFNAVEDAIVEVTESFNLKTISMTPAELLDLAEKQFYNAEDMYGNRHAGATNLRDAIKSYQTVVEALEQFSPKPARWNQAKQQLAKAVKERDLSLNSLETEYKKLAQMRDLAKMPRVFRQMMDLTDPESREHANAKRRLVIVEQALRKKKK